MIKPFRPKPFKPFRLKGLPRLNSKGFSPFPITNTRIETPLDKLYREKSKWIAERNFKIRELYDNELINDIEAREGEKRLRAQYSDRITKCRREIQRQKVYKKF